jgi:hypothetical protein
MKLSDIKSEQHTGLGYGSLTLTSESKKDIHKVLKSLNIKNIINDLHITLIYDVSNPVVDFKLDKNREYSASIKDAKTLGEPGTKWFAIALTLKSKDLEDRHNDYIKAGFKHSYPEFIPHLSLKYKPTEDDINIIKKNIDQFKDINLIFSNETLKKIKED